MKVPDIIRVFKELGNGKVKQEHENLAQELCALRKEHERASKTIDALVESQEQLNQTLQLLTELLIVLNSLSSRPWPDLQESIRDVLGQGGLRQDSGVRVNEARRRFLGKGHQRSSTPPQGPRPLGSSLIRRGRIEDEPRSGTSVASHLLGTHEDHPRGPVLRRLLSAAVHPDRFTCLWRPASLPRQQANRPVQLRRLLGDATFLGTSLPEKQSEMGPGRNCGLIYRTPCFAGSLRANLCSLQVDLQRARSSSAYLLQLRPHLLRGMP
ncbi:hypothetical protein C7M84_006605 [Penaeus vannamei]|uniref:Uncharacterized protein n=1 Tax=Penaeus vannamei TaxID=6689 RepID=A0A3R7M791_PENVA|nr:hypothetical protein C7M84_006605 [Penaeus vannamei]